MSPHRTIDAHSMTSVLSEISDIVSETLDLDEVFDRVVASVRKVIPLEKMSVIRIMDGERVALHPATRLCERPGAEFDEVPLTAWSPRWRPRPGPCPRIDDAATALDPAFPMDARVLKAGLRSGMWEPFRQGGSFVGGVWVGALAPGAFGDEHQSALRPIAALLGSAVEHWSLWETERLRRARLDAVEKLLGTLAESLDVRDVFQRLSAEIQPVLPHHLVNLTETDLRARTIRIIASAGDVPVRTDLFPLSEREVEEQAGFAIVDDIPAELEPSTERHRLIRASGLRSWLHVPVLMSGEVKGSLSFLHMKPSAYGRADAEVAFRIADRIALTLSHQRLAEEARSAAEARERADRLEARVEALALELESRDRSRIVGVSRSWKEALTQVGRVAPSETTVLITGESGTGKEVICRLIHHGSPRAGGPLVAINCAALPEQLLESELFGHEKGAFTGAVATKIGRIEQAAGGTLFLDEVAEMSPLVQAKLLRAIEAREFQRVGGTRTIRADVRFIAATNRDLAAAISRQAFREDLYYRLNVFEIHVPPLRERPEDIEPLAETFLEELSQRLGRAAAGVSREAREWLLGYAWPGNVRELRNAIERALLLCDGGLITREHLPAATVPAVLVARARADGATDPARRAPAAVVPLPTVERDLLERALSQAGGNKSKAARLLGLTRSQIYSRLGKHGFR